MEKEKKYEILRDFSLIKKGDIFTYKQLSQYFNVEFLLRNNFATDLPKDYYSIFTSSK